LDLAGVRARLTATYQSRRDHAQELVDRIPILGRLIRDFVRIEFIDRCMLIAAQGLLALVPMLVVLASFFPHLIGDAVHTFASATGVGKDGTTLIEGEVTTDQVRAQTGIAGLLITLFSASSFARAIQRMYERVWEVPHIGGVVGLRRCLGWLLGWLVTLQLAGGLRVLLLGADNLAAGTARLVFQMLALSLIWWATSWLLLFGRVAWGRLLLGAALTGVIGVAYTRTSAVVMPPYVQANADQFGTLGIILAISTWLIGFAGIMVAAALIGRIVSEDPTVLRFVRLGLDLLESGRARVRRRPPEDETAARPGAG
jgi:membrane protein